MEPQAARKSKSKIVNRLAWLTLDKGDNDPTRFLAYLIAALQCSSPSCGVTAQTILAGLPDPGSQARHAVGVLINDLLETLLKPFVSFWMIRI